MPTFLYRALSPGGDVAEGRLVAESVAEAERRLADRGLTLIGEFRREGASGGLFAFLRSPSAEDVTVFTGDLALMLRTGARINEALDWLAGDAEAGRLRGVTTELQRAVLGGQSFGEALARHAEIFPPLYVALVRVGEASGSLAPLLETIAAERQRSEALQRRLFDTLRYPAFLLVGAGAVLLFFLLAVLPQFANVFRDFNAKLDPTLVFFLGLSEGLRNHFDAFALGAAALLALIVFAARSPTVATTAKRLAARLPLVRGIVEYRSASLICRNLSLMLAAGVPLPESLRILTEMGALGGDVAGRVRQGGRLSDALADAGALPPLAVRALRLGEETGQLPTLAARVADFYETKLQRALDRVVAVAGPAAIIVISLIVGGLIVSVMTALLSVNQVTG